MIRISVVVGLDMLPCVTVLVLSDGRSRKNNLIGGYMVQGGTDLVSVIRDLVEKKLDELRQRVESSLDDTAARLEKELEALHERIGKLEEFLKLLDEEVAKLAGSRS